MCGIIIAGNKDIISNNITEITYSVLSYLHIDGAKYRIYSRKTQSSTNLTIRKKIKRIEYNAMFEGADDEGEIHLLINLKCTVIVVETVPSIINTTHSMSRVLCKIQFQILPIEDRSGHIPLYLTIQYNFMYLNLFYTSVLVFLIPPQNMFKMFP